MMRKQFLMHLLLTLIWVALTGSFAFVNFFFGFLLSFLLMWVISTTNPERRKYFKLIPQIIGFILFFIKELIKANLQVAYDVITPKFYMQPGIVSVPLDAKTDLEITLLANFITLTPGTLSLDVSDDRKVLYIHAMFVKDRDSFVREIKEGFERRLLNILR